MVVSPIDITIGVTYLLVMIGMGALIGRKQSGLDGYLLGGRDLPWWAILGSIVATETSTATFLSVPGLAFAEGGDFRFLQLAMGFALGRLIVAVVLMPRFFDGKLFSVYELLETRFGGATKKIASLLFLVARNLGDGLRLFLAGLALEQVLDINLAVCVMIIGVATIVYTFVGGMKAVVWSDCVQFVVYMLGGIIALFVLVHAFPGGWNELREFGVSTGRFRWFESGFDLSDKYTIWAGLIGGAVLTLGTHGTDQMFVQRYLSARSSRDASLAVTVSGIVVFAQFALFLLIGTALACFYSRVNPQTFERGDQVFATFIVNELPVGLVGITLAAVFAAAMSTLSSSLNSSSAAFVTDFYSPLGKSSVNDADHDQHMLRVSRGMTVVFGMVQIGVGIGASYISKSVVEDALGIAGFTAGILLGVFALGFATRLANQRGVLVGIVAGVGILSFVKFGTTVAWPWYAIIGSVTTFCVGLIASFFAFSTPTAKIESP